MNKFELAATVDRLVYGDAETFRVEDASALVAAMPAPSWRRFLPSFSLRGSGTDRSTQGFVAGFGNISMRDGGGSFDLDARGALRVGQWKLRRGWRSIEIEQMASDQSDDQRSAIIRFSFQWIATRMDILVQHPLTEGTISVSMGRYQPWKRPL